MTYDPSTSKSSLRVLNAQPDDLVMGGVQMRSVSVGKRLLDHGVRTDILVPANTDEPAGGPVSAAARENGLRVFEYHGLHRPRAFRDLESVLHNLQWVFFFPVAVARACACIRRADAHLIHVNGLLNIVPAVAAKLMGRRLLWHLIGDLYPELVVNLLRPLVKCLADDIAFLSESLKQYYFGTEDMEYFIIHEPVDLDRFADTRREDKELLGEFGLYSEQPIIGSVGNITPAKGWMYFLDTISKLVDDEPNLSVLIIGAVPDTQQEYAEKIKLRIQEFGLEEHVTLTGYRSDIKDLLNIIDVFLMTSLNEGTPLAILEAMAMGIPVVATGVGGIADQVTHSETGYVCPPKDVDALARACQTLLEDPELRREMGQSGRRRVEEKFSLTSSAKKHLRVYSNVMSIDL